MQSMKVTGPCLAMLVTALGFTATPTQAVTIDMTNPPGSGNAAAGEAVDGLASGNYSQDGVTLTISAIGGAGAAIRANATGMGVDETGDGAPTQIDQALGQAVAVVFDVEVDLLSVDFGSVGGATDAARIQSGAFDLTVFDGEPNWDNGTEVWTAPSPLNIPAGTPLILSATGTASAQNARVNVQALTFNIVPEPTSLALFGLGGLCVMNRRR